jgi:hypothetical protein
MPRVQQRIADDREAVASDLLHILHKSVIIDVDQLVAYPYNRLPPLTTWRYCDQKSWAKLYQEKDNDKQAISDYLSIYIHRRAPVSFKRP